MHPYNFFKYETIRMVSGLPFEEKKQYFYEVWLPAQQKIYGRRLIDIGYSEYQIQVDVEDKPVVYYDPNIEKFVTERC